MIRRHPWIALVLPLAVMMLVALVLAFSSLLQFVFIMTVGLPVIGGAAVASITLAVVWLVRRRRPEPARATWIGFAALGLALSVALCLPATWGSQWLLREARRPVRTMLAERIVGRTRLFGAHETIRLSGLKSLLSDDGTVDVYQAGGTTSISFADWAGPMAGGWSVYVDDESASSPLGVDYASRVERESAHWWTATEDN